MAVGTSPQDGDALVIVDVQNDFLPGGALAVPNGDAVIPVLNRYLAIFEQKHLPIFATRDWHPSNHCSFRAQGGPWPGHCVMNTPGAAFAPNLKLPACTVVISKPSTSACETYSAFEGTDLEDRLRGIKARQLFVGGLATDYCVLNTVRDARELGFAVRLLVDAIEAVNVHPDDGLEAQEAMYRLGASPLHLELLTP